MTRQRLRAVLLAGTIAAGAALASGLDAGSLGIGEQWICHEAAWLLHVYH